MMSALRGALNVAWDSDHRRPAIQGKLLDILMVVIVGLLVALSIAATATRPYIQDQVNILGSDLPLLGALLGVLMWSLTFIVPVIVSFAIFTALYRFVPAVNTTFDEIWPGALFAALAFEAAKIGFSFYIRNFGDYNAVYGSLGAVIVFMLFIFIAANVLLMGAEIASEWPRVRAGHYDRGLPTREKVARLPFRERLQGLVRQAVLGSGVEVEHVENHEIEERNRRRRQRRESREK
jgi:membrane protein